MSLDIDASRPDQLKVRFILPLEDPAGPVSVVGSFNDWTPGLDELSPNIAGTRSVTIGLPYDTELVFRYLGPQGTWFDEPDADDITSRGSLLRPIPRPDF